MGLRQFLLNDFRWLWKGTLALGMIFTISAPAFAQKCPDSPGWARDASVSLESSVARPVYRYDRTIGDLGKQDGKNRLGLTNVKTQLNLRAEVEIVPVGRGTACYRLKKVQASWKVISIDVFVAFEHRPGSCSYNATRDHENQHVAVAQMAFVHHLPRVESALKQAAGRVRPFLTTRDDNIVTNNLVDRIKTEMAPALAAFDAELKRENGALDSPASYRDVASRCRVWPK